MAHDSENENGSKFLITLDKTSYLDGYHTVVGELVEGDEVLQEVEQSLTRHGDFKNEIAIERCGTK